MRVEARATQEPTGPRLPGEPTGECLSSVNGECTARAYSPQQALALYAAKTMRQAGSELGTSCTLVREGMCTEAIWAEKACVAMRGVFKRGACATEQALGICRWKDGALVTLELGNGRGFDALDAKEDCTQSRLAGTWTDGPKFAEGQKRRAPDPSRISGSCWLNDTSCRDYSHEDPTSVKARCSGMWSSAPCTNENLAGTCRWADGMTERFYDPKPDKHSKARRKAWATECERGDAMTAGLGRMARGVWLAAE